MNFKQFCMTTLAVVAGIFITGILSIFGMILMMIQMMFTSIAQEHPSTKKNSILHIDLSSEIIERERGTTIMQQLQGIEDNSMSLNRLLDALEIASTDPKIEGAYLDCGGVSAGVATLMSVNEALNTFRNSGKWVAAYADSYAQGDYILASAADSLWLNPVGEVDIHGVGAGLFYFKGLLDKLGVDVQVFKVGTYKSAVEPFLLTEPSEANIRQTREYLDPIWADVRTTIASGRNVTPEAINTWADSIIVTENPANYPGMNVVSSLRYRHEAEQLLKSMSGIDSDDDLHLVTPTEYLNQSYAHKYLKEASKSDYKIAVLYAVGDIVQEGDEGIVGADMTPLIYELADDDDISALVLRVNSGGGSAYASEQIWEALEYFKSTGKPFYASMGDVAASGGYYISCGADKIFCQPTTLTGSIGIFGMVPNIEGLLEKHLGVTSYTIASNPNAMMSITKPFTPIQRRAMQKMIDRGYETFVGRCATGRGMPIDSIKAIAEGRVWAGTKALEIGLVDRLGNLNDCIMALAEENDIHSYSIIEYPDPEKSWWEKLIMSNAQIKQDALKKELGAAYPIYKSVESLSNMDPIQARMPFTVVE